MNHLSADFSVDKHYLAAEIYDQFYGEYAQLPGWFLEDLASRGNVLELGCGTGRIAIPLAEAGLDVTGIDYAEPMLRLAKSKAADKGLNIDWHLGDMRRLDTGKRYGSVLLLSNALWHLHDIADFEDCMRGIRGHLAPGGTLVVNVSVPSIQLLNRDPEKRYPFLNYVDRETGTEVEVTESYRYEADTQIARIVHYQGDSDNVVGDLNLRMYFPKELDALLKHSGFQVLEKFGDWDRSAFGPDSGQQLYFCLADESP
jgi:SAM-dependent methyltransferase